jgi:hypothetical protein
MNQNRFYITCITILVSFIANSQQFTQSLRGTIIDFDTKTEVPFATISILESNPLKITSSNEFGEFRFDSVPLGRISIKITAIGFQDLVLPNILLESGKEKVLSIEMQTDVQKIEEVVIKSQNDKSESLNKMALLSAKTVTVEETNRYAGSINDPARMVANFAGVVGNAEGNNDIVVRGNSPRGILWRLEGIDIPNPNHFASNGSTGGPVNMLNGSMLANSDFFSGAFAPEYGNALSGVFVVRFRQGNNEKREYSFSLGVLGIDGTLEGPFKKGYRGSYLINYRYSSIALLDGLGILDYNGIPKYQDLSFNLKFPTKKAGNFSLVGLGGLNGILQTDEEEDTKEVFSRYDFKANMGTVALKHEKVLSPKIYIKSFVSASSASNGGDATERDSTGVLYHSQHENFRESNIKLQTILNYQGNKKNTFQTGVTYTYLMYDFLYKEDDFNTGNFIERANAQGTGSMIQSFVSWKSRLTNQLTLVTGINHTSFLVNKHFVIEPRAAVKWQQSPKNDFSAGVGMHSRLESLSIYKYNQLDSTGNYVARNKDLDFTKSVHFVVGYGRRITKNMHFKTEVYYQHLYNVPVEMSPNSSFSMINFDGALNAESLVNKGTGKNYGIELTLERYFENNYYFLVTGSLYNSRYKGMDGVERDTRYNGNFAFNVLGGKEFAFGKKKNKTIGLNAKIAIIGGSKYTPIDLDASIAANTTVYLVDQAWKERTDLIFIPNLGVTYRVDKRRVSHSFKIDIQNVSNNQARLNPYFDSNRKTIVWSTQLSLVPNLIYTIKF